jgi:hypothetical protein
MSRKPKSASGRPGSQVVVETAGGKALLPGRRALNAVSRGPKTINDYSKGGNTINDYPIKTRR